MRPSTLAFVGGLALAVSAQAAPLAPNPGSTQAVVAPPIELIAGCGWGWHGVHWQDQCGYCVPNGHARHGHGTRLEHPYADCPRPQWRLG
jgi:hypothetical protein